MNKINIISNTTILETYKYEITSSEFSYKALLELTSPIKSILKERKAFLSKISVTSDNNEIIAIYKNYKTPLTEILFTIELNNNTYFVKESKNFQIPDFYIDTNFGKIEVSGNISTGNFTITLNKKIISTINSTNKKYSKSYNILYNNNNCEIIKLIISIVLIIDNLFHYY